MNWTGGRLQRHSRNSAGRSLSYTQKQHFAKVRSKLQNGPRAVSPLDFSLLHAAQDAREATESKADESGRERRPKRQKTLGEYATTAALANRLNAMKPRQSSPGQGTSSGFRHGTKRLAYANANADSRIERVSPAGHRPSKVPDPTAQDQSDDLRDHSHDVGLRSKPESFKLKLLPTALVGNGSVATPESLEDKRRNLLQQDDWVCTAITRPLKISFPCTDDRAKVGRRRRISTEERTRRILPLPRGFRPWFQEGSAPQGTDWEDRGGREDISIRIGGRVHGSQRTTLRGVEEVVSQSQHHSMSSESMLLDKEDTWYGAQGRLGLSPRTSLLRTDSSNRVPEAPLWHSVTNSASSPVLSGSSDAGFDGIRRGDKLQSDMCYRLEDDKDQGPNNFSCPDALYSDTEQSQTSSVQILGHHHQIDVAEEPSRKTAPFENDIENRDGLRGQDSFTSSKKCAPLASNVPDAGPLRLIFDSTPQTTTSQLSDTGATSIHDTQAIRSTIAEASENIEDAVVRDSDEIEWEKLVMLGKSSKTDAHSKALLPKPDTANKLIGLNQTGNQVVTITPRGTDGTTQSPSNFHVAASDRALVAPLNEMLIDCNARLQTEDEIWMKFLDISSDAEGDQEKAIAGAHYLRQLESSEEPEIPISYYRHVNESVLAQASSTSLAGTIVESPLPSSTQIGLERASSRKEGPMKQTPSTTPLSPIESTVAVMDSSSMPFTFDTYISTGATFPTSSPDPLVATTSMAPSVAAATANSPSSDLRLPIISPGAPSSDMRPPQQSRVSSPDPLTLSSPSAHVALHKIGQAATMQPPHLQRVLFTKPLPFTGRKVAATAIRKASRQPLHLGRSIAGSSSKSKSEPKHGKATARTGICKGREMRVVAGRAAPRSIYSIPSTDSDIEDGSRQEYPIENSEGDDLASLEHF